MEIVGDILRAVLTNHEVIQFAGLIVSAMLIWLMKRLLDWIGLKLRSDQLAMLGSAIDKAMTLALSKAEETIHEKGWASIETKSEVTARAIEILEEKYARTLRENGLNLHNDADRMKIIDQITRMTADVFARAAASPATPPSDVIPMAIVSPPPTP